MDAATIEDPGDRIPGALSPDQLLSQGTAAYLAGDPRLAVPMLYRAFITYIDSGHRASGFQAAFRLAMVYGTTGQLSLFNGWLARSRNLLAEFSRENGSDPTELEIAAGYVKVMEIHRLLANSGFSTVAEPAGQVLAIGRQHHCPDLLALGLVALGRARIYGGQVGPGLDMLDEGMALVLAGECTEIPNGLAWCAAIEACQEIGAIERVAEWTRALADWRGSHPKMTAFGGECSLHTGQLLALHGAWREAIAEFNAARTRFEHNAQVYAAGAAERERGDLLRIQGKHTAAESAYQSAAEYGCDPQPGLALLWFQSGSLRPAVAALERCLAEHTLQAQRAVYLPAAILLNLEHGDRPRAQELIAELDALAELTGCPTAHAEAAAVHAMVALRNNDPSAALAYARKAGQIWTELDSPYRSAQARVLLGKALGELGDTESAHAELSAARTAFTALGASPDEGGVQRLLQSLAAPPGRPAPCGLTAREVQVLRLVSAGNSNRQIATALFLSEKTVARHLSNIFGKVNVGSRTAAAAWAHEHRLQQYLE
ncbi:response regulator transcription factor [Glutamicibacter sp. MNS18]|uniref:helix-turn-helix transcriptional regulator n=1 Tax=Glutamicibacter sp. MNS18 TaxID=2989817 RepID=UPI002235E5D9|nr:helix-turn-helix transcriptional regulator [Glutamicibacter sp. MNS18]MCW4463984.1 response regulator transcription factor [Glutamicibacter sp. MNS18]